MSYEDRISIATPEGVDLELTLAGVGSRCVARLLDQLIQTAVIVALILLGALAGGAFGDGGVGEGVDEGASAGVGLAVAGVAITLFLVQFGYDVLFETLASGRTPGKRWTGLRVVRADGSPVGFVTSAVRNLLRLVDFLPGVYGVAIVAVLVSSRNQRVGDMAANTLVVREKKGGPEPRQAEAGRAHRWGDDPSGWDVSAVTPEELATVRRFLERRGGLTFEARSRLAGDLVSRLRPKVVGPPDDLDPEAFLEDLVVAKAARR
ncbi:MAG: RDD family protein [Actinomycetota bacterium]|nr:RDD family protein [Actinomycetota bacterium]